MLGVKDNLRLAVDALNAHKLRAVLTVLGLTMGVATLITVMTLVQGANLYVEQKIANLGTNVFRLAKTPFAVVDFTVIVKSVCAEACGTAKTTAANRHTTATGMLPNHNFTLDLHQTDLDMSRVRFQYPSIPGITKKLPVPHMLPRQSRRNP